MIAKLYLYLIESGFSFKQNVKDEHALHPHALDFYASRDMFRRRRTLGLSARSPVHYSS
jgi:hypothetical protein